MEEAKVNCKSVTVLLLNLASLKNKTLSWDLQQLQMFFSCSQLTERFLYFSLLFEFIFMVYVKVRI